MITVYGYDKDSDIYDKLTQTDNDKAQYELVWCARMLVHRARSTSGNEYDWLCVTKDNRDPEEDILMYLYDGTIVLHSRDGKYRFEKPEDILSWDFDFIKW